MKCTWPLVSSKKEVANCIFLDKYKKYNCQSTNHSNKALEGKNIICNAVSPGFIQQTSFHNTFTSKEVHSKVKGVVPLKRLGNASDVADLVLFLCSKRSSYINGASIHINGGLLLV